jgi:hypothetical protein
LLATRDEEETLPMPEDRTSGPSEQEPANQKSIDFLDAFIPSSKERLFLAGSIPGSKELRVVGYYSDESMLALPDNERHHVTAATYPKEPRVVGYYSDGYRRSDALITSVPFLVFDDIGKPVPRQEGTTPIQHIRIDEDVFMFLPDPSWRMETSSGCYQYGYHFRPSLAPKTARKVLAALKRDLVLRRGLHSLGQYFRLPSGTNTKPSGAGFRTKLASLGPSYTIDAFLKGFGLDLSQETGEEEKPVGEAAGGAETLSAASVAALLDLIPNDQACADGTTGVEYDLWDRVGHATWGATQGSEEGRECFVAWSAKSNKFDTGQNTSKTWDSYTRGPDVKASASTLRVIIEELYGPDSERRRDAEEIFARELFGEVDEGLIDKGVGQQATAKVEKKLNSLLQAIHRTQKVPRHHRSGDTPHWMTRDGRVQTLRQAAVSIVAPPVIVTPYERGVLSVLGGMPGLGKSLLILQQALAITYQRKDLLRYGASTLNFTGDVIYISNEDGLGVMKRRFKAWLKRHGLESTVPPFEIIPLKSTLLDWDGRAWQPKCLEILEALLGWVEQGRDIGMIVTDTLATSVTGIDENQARDINPVMLFLDRLAKAFWAAGVFVHHLNKGAVTSEDRSIVALKGSFSIGGAVRGAVTLTPATKQEAIDYGWEDREVVVEYVAKANDDRARYVACYYELETEDIEVGDAVDPGMEVAQPTPVLIPIHPIRTTDDLERLKEWFELIEAALKTGKTLRLYEAGARHCGVHSVHHVLGVPVNKAHEITMKLISVGWVKLVGKIIPGAGNRTVPCIELTKPF